MLRAIQLQIAMEQVVQLIFDRAHWNHIDAADDDPAIAAAKVSRTRSRSRGGRASLRAQQRRRSEREPRVEGR
jgi:hypothetical protein